MRMKLALLAARGARRYDGQLAAFQIQAGAAKNLPIPIYDHPFVEVRMQRAR